MSRIFSSLVARRAAVNSPCVWRSVRAGRPFGSVAFGAGTLQIDTPLDWRVLGFTTTVAIATGIVFGLAPALRATRLNLTEEFQSSPRSLSGSRSTLAHSMMVENNSRRDCDGC